MPEYMDINGVLLERYEWAGGMSMRHKQVSKSQAARKKEVEKGLAKIVIFS
jgi:hypothetical protein